MDHLEVWSGAGCDWDAIRFGLISLEICSSSLLIVRVHCGRGCVKSKMNKDALRSVFSDASRDGWLLRSDVQVQNLSFYCSYFTAFDFY